MKKKKGGASSSLSSAFCKVCLCELDRGDKTQNLPRDPAVYVDYPQIRLITASVRGDELYFCVSALVIEVNYSCRSDMLMERSALRNAAY